MKHIYYECTCKKDGCMFCEWGFFYCTVCGGFEGTLTTDCCGRQITEEEKEKIYKYKTLDFKNGEWVKK